jgi:hypothetical protein
MNMREQEHWDHVMGSASSLQNAYAESCMNRPRNVPVSGDGPVTVKIERTHYCPSTDAIVGSVVYVHERFATLEQALSCLWKHAVPEDDEQWARIIIDSPEEPEPYIDAIDEEEVPF